MLNSISAPLSWLIGVLYTWLHDYALAIIAFTLLTKIILLPVSLWAQRNSIKMVELTPELNRLKIDRYGDKDAIAEGTQELYKKRGYHPLVSLVPMFIQLALLFGVIGAVRKLLEGTDSGLSVYPSQQGGIILLMPLAAGLSALLLGLAQNRLNPLQREQPPAAQWSTNGLSIAISLILGAFVPVGVGIYWIASNLFSILQQLLLNAIMPAKKYVDYAALEASRRELAQIEGLSAGISKEDKRREKADYKRFFSVANKHLVFYSEKSGFYKYFQDVIEYLLAHSNVIIHYVTSDPKDQIFELAKTQPHIRPYYIGEKRLITLMMKMDADMVVMTMPDLENFHIKRSYVRKDVEYVFMFHGPLSMHMAMRKGCVDHFDTIFSVGPHTTREVRKIEEIYELPQKSIVECGYCALEHMRKSYLEFPKKDNDSEVNVLIAPSWQAGNIMEKDIVGILDSLSDENFTVTVRPHPQYLKLYPQNITKLEQQYKERDNIRFQTDFSDDSTLFNADVLISDWSGIAYEFAFATEKPVLFIDTPMKVMNPEYSRLGITPLEITLRNEVGKSLGEEELSKAGQAVRELIDDRGYYAQKSKALREQYFYNFGRSGEVGAKYILHSLQKKKENEA